MQVAIDSSVLVALLVPNDVWHSQANALWQAVEAAGHSGVYFVAAEAISAAARRLHEKNLRECFLNQFVASLSMRRTLAR